jgi:RimJ/RimL family protein N-acetyltransferase
MSDVLVLQTQRGPVTLRPERPDDQDFLFRLFRSHTLPELAGLSDDEAVREAVVRMQFAAQTNGYRTQFSTARFDILEHAGAPVGRIILFDSRQEACIVDFALLPAVRGGGLGTAVMVSVLDYLSTRQRIVRCKVLFNNEPSRRMCLRAGFVQNGGELPFLQLEYQPPGSSGHGLHPRDNRT